MKRKTLFIILLIIIILILVFPIYFLFNDNSKKEYSDESNEIIKNNGIEEIYKEDYSKTLDNIIKNELYNPIYLEEYLKIEEIDDIEILNNVNKYLETGYSGDEVNNILKLSKINQAKLLNAEKKDISKYIDIKNFNVDNIERYDKYLQETKYDINKVVTYVNINLDKEFYSDSILVESPNDITAIINKYNHVNKDFVPKDLVTLFDTKIGAKMVKPAAEAYEKLVKAAKEDSITLESTTAYRSYSFQNTLYTNYVAKDGVKLADTYSARPGTSEHQLGLAVDLNDPYVEGSRLDDKDYKWLLDNSYKYGFIVRYTKEGVPITGYMEEPWHIRYLGIDLATKVHESGLTYEEYYDLYMMEY